MLTGIHIFGQSFQFENSKFEISNVMASVIDFEGERVLRLERDLDKIPFDVNHLEKTVDEPTFAKLKDTDFENGIVEMKVYSQIKDPSPFEFAQGFIGLAFAINNDNSNFESIYLRPKAARSDQQFARNHSVQYYAYPDFKFEKLRQPEFKGQYETYVDTGLNEWITLRFELQKGQAVLYVNNQKNASFIINERKGKNKSGSIGLWVDIGTIGYFKDLKITKY